jgi:hypothetical protein
LPFGRGARDFLIGKGLPMSEAQTIEEVINQLTAIVDQAKRDNSRMGYFPALYRLVTITVKQRVDQGGYFDDNARMEKFDVLFAGRYLDAVEARLGGGRPTKVWTYAFDATQDWWPIALQHLLLGINAHIGLDLGVAAYETAKDAPGGLLALQGDFNRINQLLGDLVGNVKKELATVWPPLRFLNACLGEVEDGVINFSMKEARDSAWRFACQLDAGGGATPGAIDARDDEMLMISRLVRHPGPVAAATVKLIRLGELGAPRDIIDILATPPKGAASV